MTSAIYQGEVFHSRLVPKKHHFHYTLYLFWLDLKNIEQDTANIAGLSINQPNLVQFKREDYLDQPQRPLHERALERMSELANHSLQGNVFFLGQLRTLGMYFSPVNFYYLQQEDGYFSHVMAEVSNTPWNQRHHYLIELPEKKPSTALNDVKASTPKAFHVSPFNPMDMEYRWLINQPDEKLNLSIACYKKPPTSALKTASDSTTTSQPDNPLEKHFVASIQMKRQPLTSKQLRKQLFAIPSMAIKTVWGIYWQALKLLVKRVPFYGNPK